MSHDFFYSGVISSDAIVRQEVYPYKGDGQVSLESIPFKQFITGCKDSAANYKYLTSAVIISMLLTKKLHFKYKEISEFMNPCLMLLNLYFHGFS